MKVILNKDLSSLGEEGDIKNVAKGYARNFLFPRGIALPYTPQIVKMFEARKSDIEAKKEQKRKDSMGIKEKIESLELIITLPAGPNGRLYGAVTTGTIMDELAKQGFQIERKRIDLSGVTIKNVGKYKASVKLYENSSAEIQFTIAGQEIKTESAKVPSRQPRRRREEISETPAVSENAPEEKVEEIPVEQDGVVSGDQGETVSPDQTEEFFTDAPEASPIADIAPSVTAGTET